MHNVSDLVDYEDTVRLSTGRFFMSFCCQERFSFLKNPFLYKIFKITINEGNVANQTIFGVISREDAKQKQTADLLNAMAPHAKIRWKYVY